MAEQDDKDKKAFAALFELSSIGIFLVVATFIGGAIGYFLDTRVFGTFPWLSMVFLILGIVAGFRKIFQMARLNDNHDDQTHPKDL